MKRGSVPAHLIQLFRRRNLVADSAHIDYKYLSWSRSEINARFPAMHCLHCAAELIQKFFLASPILLCKLVHLEKCYTYVESHPVAVNYTRYRDDGFVRSNYVWTAKRTRFRGEVHNLPLSASSDTINKDCIINWRMIMMLGNVGFFFYFCPPRKRLRFAFTVTDQA